MKFYLLLSLIFSISPALAQSGCSDAGALMELNSVVYIYEGSNYLLSDQKTVSLNGADVYSLSLTLKAAYQYAFVLSAPKGVKATGIEIDDATGMQVQYDYKLTEGDNYILSSDFLPEYDGVYKIIFKVVPASGNVCAYVAMLVNDIDDPDTDAAPKKKK